MELAGHGAEGFGDVAVHAEKLQVLVDEVIQVKA